MEAYPYKNSEIPSPQLKRAIDALTRYGYNPQEIKNKHSKCKLYESICPAHPNDPPHLHVSESQDGVHFHCLGFIDNYFEEIYNPLRLQRSDLSYEIPENAKTLSPNLLNLLDAFKAHQCNYVEDFDCYNVKCPVCLIDESLRVRNSKNEMISIYAGRCDCKNEKILNAIGLEGNYLWRSKNPTSSKKQKSKTVNTEKTAEVKAYTFFDQQPLTPEDFQKLESSFITEDIATKAQLFRVTDQTAREMLGIKAKGDYSGIIFPYIKDGKIVSYRLRRDNPELEQKADGSTKPENKYRSAPGAAIYPYIPPFYTQEQLKDKNAPIFFVEGEKKSLALYNYFAQTGFAAIVIGLAGIWCFTSKIGKTPAPNGGYQDVKGLLRDIASLELENRTSFIMYDTNIHTNEDVKKARNKLIRTLKDHKSKVVTIDLPKELLDESINGVDDLLYSKGSDYLTNLIEEAKQKISDKTDTTKVSRPKGSVIVELLTEYYTHKLAYDATIKQFRFWDGQKWVMIETPLVRTEVQKLVKDYYENTFLYFEGFEDRDISSVMSLLQTALTIPKWKQNKNLLPLQNGVLDLKTLQLSSHKPENFNTWVLPYGYNPNAKGELITNWLFQLAQGDIYLLQLIQAFIRAVLLGRADLQIYLELIGFGGTGKGTLSRTITALIGIENTVIMDLKSLETNRFATAKLVDKRFCLINEVGSYVKDLSVFKSLTGGDRLQGERKNQPAFDFQPECLVMVSANKELQTGESTSAIARRRRHIKLDKLIPDAQKRNLIEGTATGFDGEFVDHLPGLLNWILRMNDQDMVNALRNNPEKSPLYQQMKMENLLNTHPLATWFDRRVAIDPTAKFKVGEGDEATDATLYANYKAFALATSGSSTMLSMRNFSTSLLDLSVAQLGLKAHRKRITAGVHFFGIRLRTDNDPVFSLSSLDNEDPNAPDDETPHNKPPHSDNGNSSSDYYSYHENPPSDSYSHYEGYMKDLSNYEGSMKDTMKVYVIENEENIQNEGSFAISSNTEKIKEEKEGYHPNPPHQKESEDETENSSEIEMHIEVIEKSPKILHKTFNPSFSTTKTFIDPSSNLHRPFIYEGLMKDDDYFHKLLGDWINKQSKKSPVATDKIDATVLTEAKKLHQTYLHKKSHANTDKQFLPDFEKVKTEVENFYNTYVALVGSGAVSPEKRNIA
jgi:P4 family phage/plasmid primase-like protien